MLKNKKGFTIIEVMIVIAILMIIAALIIPVFITVTTESKQTSVEIVNQDQNVQTSTDIEKTSPAVSKEIKISDKETSPVINKNSSKGESNKL